MPDVFISYSRTDRALVEALADHLSTAGFRIWWDTEILASDDFTDAIYAALTRARAIIVIWSKTSVRSHFVRDEARLALQQGKLIATKNPGLSLEEIPLGFQGQHTEDLGNRDRIVKAIEKLGVHRTETDRSKISEAPVARQDGGSSHRFSGPSAFLAGVTLRLPSFLLMRQAIPAVAGLAIGYFFVLASVLALWHLLVRTKDTPFLGGNRDEMFIGLICVSVILLLVWVHFHRLTYQRLFLASWIVAVAGIALNTLFTMASFVYLVNYTRLLPSDGPESLNIGVWGIGSAFALSVGYAWIRTRALR